MEGTERERERESSIYWGESGYKGVCEREVEGTERERE